MSKNNKLNNKIIAGLITVPGAFSGLLGEQPPLQEAVPEPPLYGQVAEEKSNFCSLDEAPNSEKKLNQGNSIDVATNRNGENLNPNYQVNTDSAAPQKNPIEFAALKPMDADEQLEGAYETGQDKQQEKRDEELEKSLASKSESSGSSPPNPDREPLELSARENATPQSNNAELARQLASEQPSSQTETEPLESNETQQNNNANPAHRLNAEQPIVASDSKSSEPNEGGQINNAELAEQLTPKESTPETEPSELSESFRA